MYIEIDGVRLRGEGPKLSGNILTLKIMDEGKLPETVIALLDKATEIRRLDPFGRVQAVYLCRKLTSATFETIGGKRIITACMMARTEETEALEALKTQVEEQRQRIDAQGELIADMEQETKRLSAVGIREERSQSDKLGYDFVHYYVGDLLARSVYEEQENPLGVADNPIAWSEAVQLIPNAYYTHEGVRKVWMGEAGTGAAWDDERWEVF